MGLNGQFSLNVWYLVVIALQLSLRHDQWFPVTFAFFFTCFLSLRVVFLEACHGLLAGYYAWSGKRFVESMPECGRKSCRYHNLPYMSDQTVSSQLKACFAVDVKNNP